MKYEQWKIAPPEDAGRRALLRAGFSPLLAAALAARGVGGRAEAEAFLRTDTGLLHDPMLLKDMSAAVERITRGIARGETIAVYGDYDVDGITSTCLLTAYLTARGAKVLHYIPDRLKEGYSLNTDAITRLRLKGAKRLITVDCGITNVEETRFARSIGMDVVITDHHECREILPDATAVVNPHRPDCTYPFKELAGVGVTLKLVLAMTTHQNRHQVLMEYADLAAVGTVADVMNLTDENRAIVTLGLQQLAATTRPGLLALLQECGLDSREVSAIGIGYTLAPRLNAAGRMGCPMVAAELLLTRDAHRGRELAQNLTELNHRRQAIEQRIYAQCLDILSRQPELAEHAIVLADKSWHQGVVGIVASRLTDRFSVPAFMICLDEAGNGKGSCRSFGGLNLFQSLEQCQAHLQGSGGHELPAGFTITEENAIPLRRQLQAIAAHWAATRPTASVLTVDVPVADAGVLTLDHVADLQQLEPYGAGNPQPVFALYGATIASISPVGKGKHTRLKATRDGQSFDGILFACPPEQTALRAGDRADLAFFPQINQFRGVRSVQLLLTDLRPAADPIQAEQQLYPRWQQGETLTGEELALLLPQRQDFVTLWRYLTANTDNGSLHLPPVRLLQELNRSGGPRLLYSRTMICLEVLQELGLLRFFTEPGWVHIRLEREIRKVDLDASRILMDLRQLLQ